MYNFEEKLTKEQFNRLKRLKKGEKMWVLLLVFPTMMYIFRKIFIPVSISPDNLLTVWITLIWTAVFGLIADCMGKKLYSAIESGDRERCRKYAKLRIVAYIFFGLLPGALSVTGFVAISTSGKLYAFYKKYLRQVFALQGVLFGSALGQITRAPQINEIIDILVPQ